MPHFLLFKPYGMLSQFTPEQAGQITLADLDFDFPKDVYPVGRLDADSEGLLLLTDDKALNFKLLNPGSHFPKTYLAQVEGVPAEQDLDALRRGVDIKINGKTHRTRPAAVRLLDGAPDLPPRVPPIRFRKSVPDCWLEIVLTEGKNRQVRRMCAAVGFPVLRLVRTGLGHWRAGAGELAGMAPGEVRVVRF
ncbi:MAG: pseudouridine synthase [Lewinellaceae bacterium]|nr:pseudouridine synthase [Lewinellaceae bacterium]